MLAEFRITFYVFYGTQGPKRDPWTARARSGFVAAFPLSEERGNAVMAGAYVLAGAYVYIGPCGSQWGPIRIHTERARTRMYEAGGLWITPGNHTHTKTCLILKKSADTLARSTHTVGAIIKPLSFILKWSFTSTTNLKASARQSV